MNRRAAKGWLALLLVWTLWIGVSTASAAVRITVPAAVEITGQTLLLGDVVTLQCDQTVTCQRLSKLSLGNAPLAGYKKQLTRAWLRATVAATMPDTARRMQWHGESTVTVEALSRRYSTEGLVIAAHYRLSQWLQNRFDHFAIHPVGDLRDLRLPYGRARFETRSLRASRPQKRMAVWVDVWVDDRLYQSVPVWFAVTVEQPVWQVQQVVRAGNTLRQSGLTKTTADITRFNAAPVAVTQDLTGYLAGRTLQPGDVVTEAALKTKKHVNKGETVQVRVHHNSMSLMTKAVALQDGNKGERVKVKNPDGRTYAVYVIGPKITAVGQEGTL